MDDKQIVLYAARHGTTTLNANGCFRGHVNPPLDSEGFKDANRLAHYFSNLEINNIYASPRLRATQTAQAIVNRRHEKFQEVPDLDALDVGKFSGKPKSPENIQELEQYIHSPNVQIPDGESLNEFRARVRPVFHEAIKQYEQTGIPDLLVVHSSIIHELGQMFNNDRHSSRVEPGGVAALYYCDGEFHAEPILKPLKKQQGKVDTVS